MELMQLEIYALLGIVSRRSYSYIYIVMSQKHSHCRPTDTIIYAHFP